MCWEVGPSLVEVCGYFAICICCKYHKDPALAHS